MPSDASSSVVCSSGTMGFSDLDSGMTSATTASTPEDPVVPAIASGTAADPSVANAAHSSSPRSPAVVVDSSSSCRALGDSGMVAVGAVSTMGSALGGSVVWTGGVRPSACFALHQISSSSAKKTKK